MSIVNIFTRKSPKFGIGEDSFEFDAVLEDTFEASVEFTEFPIELGANAVDHGVIQPKLWRILGVVSNNPLKTDVTDFIGGALSNLSSSGVFAGLAGLTAGFTAGTTVTRSSAALEELLKLMNARQPFDIDAGDIQLLGMVVTRITRTKNPLNENALVFAAELQELATLNTVISNNQPGYINLRDGDPAKTQAMGDAFKGEVLSFDPDTATTSLVTEVFA